MLGMRCGVIVGDVSFVFDAKRPNFPQFIVSVLVIRDYFIIRFGMRALYWWFMYWDMLYEWGIM